MPDDTNPIPRVTRDDPAAHSGDVMAENVATLKALFPAIVTDGKVDFDVLRQLLGDAVDDGAERYGLNWKGKSRARAFALTPSLGTLRPAKADSVDWDTTKNIVIEGDNLEVLKLLRKSYGGKVKLIYIDPPYNTGKDFVYPDNYADSLASYEALTGQRGEDGARLTSNKETSGRFHTDWLNMMYPRLMLAKELLRSDGFIAISIDYHELANLRILMDYTFGAECLKNVIVVRRGIKNVQAQFADIDSLAVGHEYILLYAANGTARLPILSKQLDDFQPGKWDTFWRGTNRATMRYELFGHTPQTGQWRWSKDRTEKAVKAYQEFRKTNDDDEQLDAFYIAHLEATREQLNFVRLNEDGNVQYYVPPTGTKLVSDNWLDITLSGSETEAFDTEKSVGVLRRAIAWLLPNDHLILDFFAGSGTTGHAVMTQNAIDGGSRRYILVQLPEPLDPAKAEQKTAADFCDKLGKPRNIAELTKERLRRAGTKVKAEHPEAKPDTGFRVYKLATSNLKPWQPGDDLVADLLDATTNVLPGRSEDDLLVELLLKTGIDLALPSDTRTIAGRTVHIFGGGTLVVCLADIAADEARALGDAIADWLAEVSPPDKTTFFFKDSGFDAGGNRAAEARANLAATLRQRLGDEAIEKLGAI